jgi:succinate dehydrogenase / fumarate reductase, iron-sulfur subunit
VIKDLVPDLTHVIAQYASIEPWLRTVTPAPERERLQSPEERNKLSVQAAKPALPRPAQS